MIAQSETWANFILWKEIELCITKILSQFITMI